MYSEKNLNMNKTDRKILSRQKLTPKVNYNSISSDSLKHFPNGNSEVSKSIQDNL